jgi:hypothetical protein
VAPSADLPINRPVACRLLAHRSIGSKVRLVKVRLLRMRLFRGRLPEDDPSRDNSFQEPSALRPAGGLLALFPTGWAGSLTRLEVALNCLQDKGKPEVEGVGCFSFALLQLEDDCLGREVTQELFSE